LKEIAQADIMGVNNRFMWRDAGAQKGLGRYGRAAGW
jgi:hypothetical protein